jgi:general secretion pathway protein C
MRFRSSAGARRTAPQLATALLFAALCATATYWGLQLFAPPVAIAPSGSLVDWDKAPDLATASRLFGSVPSAEQAAQAAVASSNIKVIGVAAASARGSAVLSIDGKPARAYLAGEPIDEHARLVEVRSDVVVIEQGGGRIELPTPERPDIAILSAGPGPGLSGISLGNAGRQGALTPGAGRSPTMAGARGAPAGTSAPGPASAAPLPPYGADAAPAEEQNTGAMPDSSGALGADPSQAGEISAAASENTPPPPIRSRNSRPGAAGSGSFGAAPARPAPGAPGVLRPGVRGALESLAEPIA